MTDPAWPVDELCSFCAALPGATCDNTFGEQTNVYRVGEKMFALVNVDPGTMVTVKVVPDDGEALRAAHPWIRPGYYMNKRHWVSVDFVSEAVLAHVCELVEDSYRLVHDALQKRLRPR